MTVEIYIRDAVWPSVALKKIVGNQILISEDDLRALALAAPGVARSLAGRDIRKVIVVPPRLVNIVPA